MAPTYRRVVIKLGTAVATRPGGHLALGRLGALAETVHQLRGMGIECLVVSSGAVGLGAQILGFASRPRSVVDRQACAAAGQGALIRLYDELLGRLGETTAQVLLTEDDFLHREQYLNVHATLERLLALGAVPVLNENDTVSTAEIALRTGEVFGDNDRLSALVSAGIDADLLVMLTNVDGVYTHPPDHPDARLVQTFEEGTSITFGSQSELGRGGMQSKIRAAGLAARCGVHAVIASGDDPGVVLGFVQGDTSHGTHFLASPRGSKRQRWLAFATAPEGIIEVNAGAREALLARDASLLPVGVTAVHGSFPAGTVVAIREGGKVFARGICGSSSEECRQLVGQAGKRPLVHRNDIVQIGGLP